MTLINLVSIIRLYVMFVRAHGTNQVSLMQLIGSNRAHARAAITSKRIHSHT
jgi:hypothetical protein